MAGNAGRLESPHSPDPMQHPANSPEGVALSALLFLPLALLWLAYAWVLAEFGTDSPRACPTESDAEPRILG